MGTKQCNMFSLRLTILALVIYCSPLYAQDLTPSELTSIKTYKLKRIDSLMLAKGFEKQVISEEKGQTITSYTFRKAADASAVQRSLLVGNMPANHVLDLQYGMWQQTESISFTQQLLRDGYKKVVTSIPDMDGKSAMKMISYKKGANNISYQEKDQGNVKGKNVILYIFSLSNENYR